jgi:hypothetical protein
VKKSNKPISDYFKSKKYYEVISGNLQICLNKQHNQALF